MIEQALCPIVVGRDREGDALEDALLDALRGDGRFVLLAGEAGMGKSRLARQLVERAERLGAVVLWGACSEAEFALPYLPLVESLGNHVATVGAERIRARLGPAARDLGALIPQLGRGDADLNDNQAKLRLFEAVFQLIQAEALDGGLLLIVEDIHWADASTRELLDFLARRLRATRVVLLATYRPDEMHRRHPLAPFVQAWRRTGAVTVVELQPFGAETVAGMVRAIFGTDEVSPEFRDLLYQRSEGNPFVLEEMLKDAMDRGDIYRTAAGWERRAVDELQLPATVRDSILQRIERLPASAVDALRAAAVLGSTVRPELLPGVCGCSAGEIDDALVTLVNEQLLDLEPQERRYRFRHALTREAVYDDIVLPRREALHSRAADALAGRVDTQPVDLALQLLAAGRFDEAVPVCLEAAREAEERSGDREAAQLYRRVLPYVTEPGQRGLVLIRLGRATWRVGETAAAQPYLIDGIALLEAVADVAASAAGHLTLGRVIWEQSRQDEARIEYERARDLLEPLGPSEDLANAYVRLGSLETFQSEFAKAIEFLDRAVAIADAAGATAARLWALGFRGLARVGMGEVDEGFAEMAIAYREAVDRGFGYVALNTIYNETELRCLTYDARGALELSAIMERDHPQFPPGMQTALGRAFANQVLGELETSHAEATRVIELARDHGQQTYELWGRHWDALTLAWMGRVAEAAARLEGRPRSIERQDIVSIGKTLITVSLVAGRIDEAADIAAEALAAIDWPRPLDPDAMHWLEIANEAFIAAGRLDDARRITSALDDRRFDAGGVATVMARARLAIAEGRGGEAIEPLRAAIAFFDRVGYVIATGRARGLLAEALLAVGDADGATDAAATAAETFDVHGAAGLAHRLRARLSDLGIEIAPASLTAPVIEPAGSLASQAPEERLVTVLFVDIRGYTAFAGETAPESLVDRVGSFHRWARAEIEAEGGLVDKFAGDAVMATFNVVSPRLDHAVAALRSASGIRDKAAAAGFSVGAGIAVGPVVVGALVPGGNVSAIGTPTNLAARLQSQAAGGEILLSGEAYRRCASWLAERQLDAQRRDLELKGFEGPVEAWAMEAR